MKVGFHVSIFDSIDTAVDRAEELGINTFQMFTRNPRGWSYAPLDPAEISLFKMKLANVSIDPVFVHMPYLPNLSSSRREVYDRSCQSLTGELQRCNELGVPFLVTHLGSHLGSGKAMGFQRIIDAINSAYLEARVKTMLLLENTAGTTNSMGSSFEDIQTIIDHVTFNEQIGLCLDTCHAFVAGYDLRGKAPVENVLKILDSVIGLERLKLIHLNDSLGGFRSHLDRHEHIGLGKIGKEGFRAILNSKFGEYPLILETPIDERRNNFENLLKVSELANIS